MKQKDIQLKTFHLKGDDRILFCTEAVCDYNLNVLSVAYIPVGKRLVLPENWTDKKTWRRIPQTRLNEIVVPKNSATLGGVYEPAAEIALETAYRMHVNTPDSMDESTAEALRQLKKAVGNVAEFVAERLQYSITELADCLALEQIDAVALAIYNVEAREQGLIVGDQTGIGKGRVAAAFIRYAVLHGFKPIFFTEKPGLFTDIYRDLEAIHTGHLRPLIVNATGGNVIDEDGNDVEGRKYDKKAMEEALATKKVPKGFDFVCCTYSQLRDGDADKENGKGAFIAEIAKDNILIMDESHNAGGEVEYHPKTNTFDGRTGLIFQTKILPACKGIMYLSATYAKFPKNMPVYAINTCISDINPSFRKKNIREMVSASAIVNTLSFVPDFFKSLPAQEIISSAMAKYGQFIRRERPPFGSVDYITLDAEGADIYGVKNLKDEHYMAYSKITNIISDIRDFQERFFIPYLKEIAKKEAEQGDRTRRPPTVASASIFSSLFRTVNNVLLSLKAESIAERAMYHLDRGRGVVIALADTGEASLEVEDDFGDDAAEWKDGVAINADYTAIFDRIFKSLFYYRVGRGGKRIDINVEELGKEAVAEYKRILHEFATTTTGLCRSPIDEITYRLEKEGYKVAECTGRKKRLVFERGNLLRATVQPQKKYSAQQGKHVSLCFKKFNDNDVDVLIINQSGSTGKSAHATHEGTKLKPHEVRQRVMIIGQAELDVNTEVQKRGRINRTGQDPQLPPIYEYIYSAIPCEKRFMMMLKAKLKSLDANTTSNQKQSGETVLKSEDFFNKYGDEIVERLLREDTATNRKINDPLGIEPDPINPKRKKQKASEMARTAFGRMQVLSPYEQESWYNNVLQLYNEKVEELKAEDKFDLEIREMDFRAKKISENVLLQSEDKDGYRSELVGSSFLTRYNIRSQAKFKSLKDVKQIITSNVQTKLADTDGVLERLKNDYKLYVEDLRNRSKERLQNNVKSIEEALERHKATLANLIENRAYIGEERIERQKNVIDDTAAKLAEAKKGIDPDLDERLGKAEEKYKRLEKAVRNLNAGSVYLYDNNYYIVTSCHVSEDANIFTKSSAINAAFVTTDVLQKTMLAINLAETGLDLATNITAVRAGLEDYERYINDDTRREEVSIITGNIIKHLAGDNVVITRYTLEDGSTETGIVVRPIIEHGVARLPDYAKYTRLTLNPAVAQAVMKVLTSAKSVSFASSGTEGIGLFSIEGQRFSDSEFKFMLTADRSYKDFLDAPELEETYANKWNKVFLKENNYRGFIKDIKKFLEVMTERGFEAQVEFTDLGDFKNVIDVSKYKAKDWKPLGYDKSKIPTNYVSRKNLAGRLLTIELKLLKLMQEGK